MQYCSLTIFKTDKKNVNQEIVEVHALLLPPVHEVHEKVVDYPTFCETLVHFIETVADSEPYKPLFYRACNLSVSFGTCGFSIGNVRTLQYVPLWAYVRSSQTFYKIYFLKLLFYTTSELGCAYNKVLEHLVHLKKKKKKKKKKKTENSVLLTNVNEQINILDLKWYRSNYFYNALTHCCTDFFVIIKIV